MTTDPRLLETLRRLATKGIPDTMPISLCPEGAAVERIEQLDAENATMRAAISGAIEAIERGSTSAPVLECLKAAISSGKLDT